MLKKYMPSIAFTGVWVQIHTDELEKTNKHKCMRKTNSIDQGRHECTHKGARGSYGRIKVENISMLSRSHC